MINSFIIIGFIIHAVLTALMFTDSDYSFLGLIFIPFVLANIVGMILIGMKKTALGARIFMYSSFIFVPIGLIGILGARKELNILIKDKFYQDLNS